MGGMRKIEWMTRARLRYPDIYGYSLTQTLYDSRTGTGYAGYWTMDYPLIRSPSPRRHRTAYPD